MRINPSLHSFRSLFLSCTLIAMMTATGKAVPTPSAPLDSLSGNEIRFRPVENVVSTLPGLIPGIDVISPGPLPGVSPLTSIHGLATLSGLRQPLFVVDGVPVETLEDLDPADVASVKVLTDASGAALYGVRGADGVILVSTVRPELSSGNRPDVDFIAAFMLDDSDDDYVYDGIKATRSVAPGQKYHLSVGNDNGRRSYRASIGYFGQSGLIRSTSADRLTARADYSTRFGQIFTGGISLSASRREMKAPFTGQAEKREYFALLPSAFLQADLDNGLKLKLDGAYRYRNHSLLPYPFMTFTGYGLLRGTLSYDYFTGHHNLDLYAGASFESFRPFDSNLISTFANFSYDYAGRYSTFLSLRADGLKGSVKERSWSLSPSVSASWTLSNESFWPAGSVISDMKLNIAFSHMATGTPLYGITSEKTAGRQAGLEAGFFNGRINLAAAFYTRTISGMGLITITDRLIVGKVFSKGLDLKISSINLRGPLSWQTDLTMTYACNHVTEPGAGMDGALIDGIGVIKNGEPLGSLCMYDAVGYYANAEDLLKYPTAEGSAIGDVRYRDANDDGVIDENDRTLVGKPDPEFTFGLNNSLSFRRWDLSLLLTARVGGWVYKNQPGEKPDSRGIRKSDCLTVRNITLGYSLPMGESVSFIRECRIFAGAENLVSTGETGYYLTGYQPDYCSTVNRTLTIGVQARF